MAENPRWGYVRIEGELLKLGISVSATTIATVLRRSGLGPGPATHRPQLVRIPARPSAQGRCAPFRELHLGVKDGVLARDEWGTDILDELAPGDDDTVVYKTRFSGFYRTELDELLEGSGIKHLIVTGCTTSICVESTIRDAFFRDYHCVLLEDCTAEPMGASLSRSNHEATILLVERIFGSVSTSSNFIKSRHAGRETDRLLVASIETIV